MVVAKSQRMSIGGIVGWSMLCGVIVSAGAIATAAVLRWTNEFAFRDLSMGQMIALIAGMFLLGTVLSMGFLFKIKWLEEEGPAKIADQIEKN